ncbi:MAG: pantoate--beta-alanine ligase [Candidatus Hydrogenedentota bacterium]
MNVLETAEAMRSWSWEHRNARQAVGFVPTMGALHEGHASLIRRSVADCDVTVISIFVNPVQFGPNEDYERYPRTFEADKGMADELGVDAIYAPDAQAMYPADYATYVDVLGPLTETLCGRSRPGHFRGVATVVAKLFNAVRPHRAYFGQKDAQQLAVIQRMTRDLDFGIEIVGLPIVREADGLARSSRNQYLAPEERERALCIPRALEKGRALMTNGERSAETVRQAVRDALAEVDAVDYVELVDAETLEPLKEIQPPALLAVAARVGETRLIDNIKLEAT